MEEFGISAESSVFIDDKAMNIAGANEAGIRGIRFSDARKLRELLIEQGIDIPAVSDLRPSARRPAFDDDDRADGLKSQYRGRKRNTC